MCYPTLSIVVPVYNVENYINKCIDSIINQTFKDWELLLIDDGSSDNSGTICDEYVCSDQRIKVFHKVNGGVSSARNLGLDNANGKWVTFIDADDFISSNFIDGLFKPLLFNPDLDFVQGGCSNWKNGKVDNINQLYDNYIGSEPDIVFEKFRGLAVSKLFRLENVNHWSNDLPLRFDINMKIAEDMAFTLDYLLTVKKYAFVSEVGYFYRIDNDSSSTHTFINESFVQSKESFMHLYESTVKYIDKFNISPKISKLRYEQRAAQYLSMLRSMYYDKTISKKERLEELKEQSKSKYFYLLNFIDKVSNNYNDAQSLKKGRFIQFDIKNIIKFYLLKFKTYIKFK